MSLKSIIEKCIALVTGKDAESSQGQEENQQQNFEQNSEESFSIELDEPVMQEETFDIEEPEESFEELCEEVSQETESYNIDLGAPVQQQKSWTMQDEQLNETESFEQECIQQDQMETIGMQAERRQMPIEHAADQVHNPDFFHEEELH